MSQINQTFTPFTTLYNNFHFAKYDYNNNAFINKQLLTYLLVLNLKDFNLHTWNSKYRMPYSLLSLFSCNRTSSKISLIHWHRFVKNIGGKPKYWRERVAITDESTGVTQLLGARARAAPQSLHLWSHQECPLLYALNYRSRIKTWTPISIWHVKETEKDFSKCSWTKCSCIQYSKPKTLTSTKHFTL